MENQLIAFQRLLDIMDRLRAKCPWDSKQTFESLRCLTIEETFELSDAIIDKDSKEICNELGDLMLHIVFYTKLASEQKMFTMTELLDNLCDKLVRRHPHIYGNVKVDNEQDVKENWEKIKLEHEDNRSVLGGVPSALPAMIKAYRIQDKVKGVGFDWNDTDEVWKKVEEEIGELQTEVKKHSDRVEDEFGDVLFSLINYARFINVHPEDALEKTNRKFINRFQILENMVKEDSKKLSELSLEEMEAYWQKAKLRE